MFFDTRKPREFMRAIRIRRHDADCISDSSDSVILVDTGHVSDRLIQPY